MSKTPALCGEKRLQAAMCPLITLWNSTQVFTLDILYVYMYVCMYVCMYSYGCIINLLLFLNFKEFLHPGKKFQNGETEKKKKKKKIPFSHIILYIYIYMYVCMYVCIITHTHTHTHVYINYIKINMNTKELVEKLM
jgi:Na+/melibiose symporter-like transporter